MQRTLAVVAFILVAPIVLAVLLPAAGAVSDEIQKVLVVNFPATQRVAGTVDVTGPIKHASMVRLKDIQVPPVGPKETTRLVNAGDLVADGFTSVVLSLDGQTRGKALKQGAVGAILIPEEELVVKAFDNEGLTHFSQEVAATSGSGASQYFASSPSRFTVAFPQYRVLLYNTTDKSAAVNLYAYMTN